MLLYVVLKEGELMEINEILKLDIKQVNDVPLTNKIKSVYVGDLLSFVMANGKEDSLWLTVQKHINVIAVAQLNDFAEFYLFKIATLMTTRLLKLQNLKYLYSLVKKTLLWLLKI